MRELKQAMVGLLAGAVVLVGILAVLFNIVAVLFNNDLTSDHTTTTQRNDSDPPPGAIAGTMSVTYKVTGTAKRASLSYINEQGGTQQEDVSVPWDKDFVVVKGRTLYLWAQNKGETGKVTCVILVNHEPFKKSTSSGAYTMCTAAGMAGQ